ncbi:hypothetical protein NDU88_003133 [Pleurodeles waltl]|uniref:Uncharacterized protein n=1 Tax=Pleurodeles waltl TaxID=8319 RepID=A0AAV7MPX3_PLEWA|nr:hypothetical protein NDU88_003133 [Pleurodeles waltl]
MIETVSPFSLSIADLGVLSPFLRSETRQRRARPVEKRVTFMKLRRRPAHSCETPVSEGRSQVLDLDNQCEYYYGDYFAGIYKFRNAPFTVFFTIVSLVVEVVLDNL